MTSSVHNWSDADQGQKGCSLFTRCKLFLLRHQCAPGGIETEFAKKKRENNNKNHEKSQKTK